MRHAFGVGRRGLRRWRRVFRGAAVVRRPAVRRPEGLHLRDLALLRRRRRFRNLTVRIFRVELDHHAAARGLQQHEAGLRQLLGEIEKRRGAVVAFGECGVELQQRALEQARLRRNFALAQNLERAAHERKGGRQRLRGERRRRRRGARVPLRGAADAVQVFVGDELVAVLLEDLARERPSADDEHFLVVLLQLLDEREEVAVAADDDVGVDVLVRERHLERVERHVDVRAVLVAARREVALHEAHGMLREVAAVVAGARPVGVRDLADDLAFFLDALEDDTDVERLVEGVLDADFDVVEVDEYCDVQAFLLRRQI